MKDDQASSYYQGYIWKGTGQEKLFWNSCLSANWMRIVWYNAQGDKMPKYDKMPKVIMPKGHFAQVRQNAQGDKMPKRHYAQDDKMPKTSFCPRWQNAQIVIMPKVTKCSKWHYVQRKASYT